MSGYLSVKSDEMSLYQKQTFLEPHILTLLWQSHRLKNIRDKTSAAWSVCEDCEMFLPLILTALILFFHLLPFYSSEYLSWKQAFHATSNCDPALKTQLKPFLGDLTRSKRSSIVTTCIFEWNIINTWYQTLMLVDIACYLKIWF